MKKVDEKIFLFVFFACLIFVGVAVCLDLSKQADQLQSSGQTLQDNKPTRLKFLGATKETIKLHELYLYKLLLQVKTNINSVLNESLKQDNDEGFFQEWGAFFSMCNPANILADESESSYTKKLFAALRLSEEALKLMKEIVQGLNKEALAHNPEIEIFFINMCNLLKGEETVCPWDLRRQLKGIKQFNQYLMNYCISRKDFLEVEDLKLFDKITKFNQILMLCILRDEYFDIGVDDRFMDTCFHRPIEFIARHKILAVSVPIAIVGSLVGYWYLNRQGFFDSKQQSNEQTGRDL